MGLVLFTAVTTLGLGACGPPNQPPQSTGVNCASYGGCDVVEDLADGSTITALHTMSYTTADLRARTDAQLPGVRDTLVVGHDPPQNAISKLYHRGPEP